MNDSNIHFGNEHHGVIVDFLRGQRPDWDGRWLPDIRGWDAGQLEHDHHYIQWLFPLTTESEVVFAPILRAHELRELRQDGKLREESIVSLRQLLGFYGFEMRADGKCLTVVESTSHRERRAIWMTPGNHNYRRISRILGSLVLQEMEAYAKAFMLALEQLRATSEGAAAIDQEAVWYWRRRASAR